MASIKFNPGEVVAMGEAAKQAVSDRTARVLRATVKGIKARDFDMGQWGGGHCGTVACLGGHICLRAGYLPTRTYSRYRKLGKASEWVFDLACYVAGIADDSGINLFHLSCWPDRFANEYRRAKTGRERLSALGGRVEYFIRTGR